MEKWSGWRRGAQCDWVQAATQDEVKAAVVKATEVETTVKIAAQAAMAAKK